MAYIRAIAAGDFSNPAIWNGGVVPAAGDFACPDTFRIVLDVDTAAVLTVVGDHLVAAGGVAGATKAGGFSVPAGATRNLPGGIQYDATISVARNTNTTVPVHVQHGNVTIGSITYVTGSGTQYLSTSVSVVNCSVTTATTLVLVVSGTISLGRVIATSISRAISITGATGAAWDVTLHDCVFDAVGATNYIALFLFADASATRYKLTLNGVVDAGASTGPIQVNHAATNDLLQNVFVNTTDFGVGGWSGAVMFLAAVNNVTTGGDIVLSSAVATGWRIVINSMRGAFVVNGSLSINSGMCIQVTTTSTGVLRVLGLTTLIYGTAGYAIMVSGTGRAEFADIDVAVTAAIPMSSSWGIQCGDIDVVCGHITALPQMMSFVSAIVFTTAGTDKTMTINGDVDARNCVVLTNSTPSGLVNFFARHDGAITINGDVYGADKCTSTVPTLLAGALCFATATTYGDTTINGNVYGGGASPGLVESLNCNVNTTITGNVISGVNAAPNLYPAPAVALTTQIVSIGGLDAGALGRFPIAGRFKFISRAAADFIVLDDALVPFAMSSGIAAIIPAASNVRQGVAVGSTVGSLVVPQAATVQSGVVYDNGTTGALAGLTSADLVPIAKEATLAAVKGKTDQLTFTGSGVVADSSGASTDYTTRFDALDTVTAAVKTKTDQLTFTVSGVVADAGAANYTSRFNSLDAAVAAIPTVTYSARFDSIDTDLGNLIAGGGVDFTPVLTALTAVDGHVSGVQTTANTINAKTSQLGFTVDGVVADVSVSVGNVINYDTRFDAVDTAAAAIKAKTDLLTFGASGVNATATIDAAPITSAVSAAVAPIHTIVADTNADLALHDTQIKAQLTTIQNATGAIDLSPITASLATINTNVLAIPTTTYSGRFNSVDAQLVSIQADVGNVSVDLTPVTAAIAAVDTHVLAIPTTSYTASLQAIAAGVAANSQATDGVAIIAADTLAAVNNNMVDLTPVLEAIDSHVVDLTPVTDACAEIKSRFDAVTPGPITIIPQSPSGTSTAYGYVRDANGAPLAGETVTLRVTQAHGTGTILDATPITATSDAEGLVTFTIIRSPDIVYSVQFGLRTEKFRGVDAATVQLPSMIKR